MKKLYDSPEMDIDKFSIRNCVITESPNEGWGGNGDDYGDDDF